jgi:enoyl-CoA hydratase/carnithine racemase
MGYETILYESAADHVATITLNRPEKLNTFNPQMQADFRAVWAEIKADDDVNAIVLRAAGDRGFSAGLDVTDRQPGGYDADEPPTPFNYSDPGDSLGAKSNRVWKPLICALHGIVAGGAQYWVNESDIVICADDTMFFDPHVTYGMTSALEPIGLTYRIPLGETLRWALMGLDERMGAERAHQIGLVSEVVPRDQLFERAHEIAAIIAAKPSVATQGTVKAIWESLELPRSPALRGGIAYFQLGNPIGERIVERGAVTRPEWKLR